MILALNAPKRASPRKANNENQALEQENIELKSQIELLRAALLDLCHEKNVNPLQVISVNQDIIRQSPKEKSQSPTKSKPSPGKGSEPKRTRQGTQRRRRSQRQGSNTSITPRRLGLQAAASYTKPEDQAPMT